jgi:regulator of replication initiation timing
VELNFAKLDLGVLDALKAQREESKELESRLVTMEEKRGAVSASVYARVRADYLTQQKELEQRAIPLQQQMRSLYAQVRDGITKLEAEFAEAKLRLEEIDFRHQLGEYDAAEHTRLRQAAQKPLQEREQAGQQAARIKARFLQVVNNEAELDEPAPTTSPGSPLPVDRTGEMPAVHMAQNGDTTERVATVPMPPAPAIVADLGQTSAMPAIKPPPPLPPAAAKAERNPDATVVFRPGKLQPLNAEAGMAVATLSLKPVIVGSDNSCDVRVSHPGVATRHAEISLSRQGFTIRSLGANAVVTINGVAVTEQLLKDADQIQIGPARFGFKQG